MDGRNFHSGDVGRWGFFFLSRAGEGPGKDLVIPNSTCIAVEADTACCL